jgi:hypothetical protein
MQSILSSKLINSYKLGLFNDKFIRIEDYFVLAF